MDSVLILSRAPRGARELKRNSRRIVIACQSRAPRGARELKRQRRSYSSSCTRRAPRGARELKRNIEPDKLSEQTSCSARGT